MKAYTRVFYYSSIVCSTGVVVAVLAAIAKRESR